MSDAAPQWCPCRDGIQPIADGLEAILKRWLQPGDVRRSAEVKQLYSRHDLDRLIDWLKRRSTVDYAREVREALESPLLPLTLWEYESRANEIIAADVTGALSRADAVARAMFEKHDIPDDPAPSALSDDEYLHPFPQGLELAFIEITHAFRDVLQRLRQLDADLAGELTGAEDNRRSGSGEDNTGDTPAGASANGANTAQLFPEGVPKNPRIVDLVCRLDAEKAQPEDKRRAMIVIAREYTGESMGNDKEAKSLLSQIRRMKRDKDVLL